MGAISLFQLIGYLQVRDLARDQMKWVEFLKFHSISFCSDTFSFGTGFVMFYSDFLSTNSNFVCMWCLTRFALGLVSENILFGVKLSLGIVALASKQIDWYGRLVPYIRFLLAGISSLLNMPFACMIYIYIYIYIYMKKLLLQLNGCGVCWVSAVLDSSAFYSEKKWEFCP
jgi:hypothetical protein